MKKLLLILAMFLTNCSLIYPKPPDPNYYLQDNLFCWVKIPKTNIWIVKGENIVCPKGTLYVDIIRK